MDEIAVGAVSAVWHTDTDEAERWFDLIRQEHQTLVDADSGQDWDQFKQALASRAEAESFSTETVDGFVEHLEAVSTAPMDVVAQLADPNEKDALLQVYTEALDAAYAADESAVDGADTGLDGDSAGAGEEPFDEAGWMGYLAQWDGGWDGNEDSWANFAERVVYYAPDEFKVAAGEFVRHTESQPDRVAALGEYGLSVAVADVAAEVDTEAPEVSAEEAYDQELVELASLDDEESLADTGVEVGAMDEVHENILSPALAELFQEMPEAADIPPDRLRELIAEVIEQELTAATPS